MPDTVTNDPKKNAGTATDWRSATDVLIGRLHGIDELGRPFVDWPGNSSGNPVEALSTNSYGADDIGREAALLFVGGDLCRPLIVGLIHRPLDRLVENTEGDASSRVS